MELRQIEIFRAIAAERHFGRAARRLFLAQGSVSASLQRLEAELGVLLVHRTSRQVELTPAGRAFLDASDDVVGALDRAVRAAREGSATRAGRVRIATNYPASRLVLLPLIELLQREAPGIRPELHELGTEDQLTALEHGDLDLGLLYGPVAGGGLGSRHLLDVPVVATVRPGHPLADLGTVGFRELLAFPYLTGTAGGSRAIDTAVAEAARRSGAELASGRRDVETTAYQLRLETTDTVGFCSLPRGEQNRSQGFRLLRIGPVEPILEIHAAWRRSPGESAVNIALEALSRLATARADAA